MIQYYSQYKKNVCYDQHHEMINKPQELIDVNLSQSIISVIQSKFYLKIKMIVSQKYSMLDENVQRHVTTGKYPIEINFPGSNEP